MEQQEQKGWKQYFSFSVKERSGIIGLLMLMGIISVVPIFKQGITKQEEYVLSQEDKQLIADLQSDTAGDDRRYIQRTHPTEQANSSLKFKLFSFDPNTLSPERWKDLGVKDRTITTIQRFLSKGGKFRTPDDIKKIYGLRQDEIERLIPYVKIASSDNQFARGTPREVKNSYEPKKEDPRLTKSIDLNTADSALLESLPGIGEKLASRIIKFRSSLGGFCSVEQLKEIYGLSDSSYQKLRQLLTCEPASVVSIDVNVASETELKAHPYIRWKIARAIVEYRNQHGPFKSTDEIKQLAAVPPEIIPKLMAYLKVN
ncbi:MAG: helix-hairpin-helix domain-containing protein [Chitinophagaceae bacterium]|nr:helix-hairpin-helix domain-containing protein [Chitinophagaceae bacterium]